MFDDNDIQPITIISDVIQDKYVRDQLCQTRDMQLFSKSSQMITRNDAEVQTYFEEELPQVTRMKIDNSKALTEFMAAAYPLISEQLLANSRSHAFDDYVVDWEEHNENNEITNKISLSYKDLDSEKNVTAITWNCIGSVIACAFGSITHLSWCVHPSYVCFWNIDRANINEEKPDKVIEIESCLMTVAFHPKEAALLIGGDFSGKVYVWDLSQTHNFLVASSGKETISHQEPVSKIAWMTSQRQLTHKFVSTGRDGKILVWEYKQIQQSLRLSQNFLLQNRKIHKSFSDNHNAVLGITCMTFFKNNYLLVGVENGGVFKCIVEGKSIAAEKGKEDKNISPSPVSTVYNGHVVTVNSIDVCPCVRDKFVTCASDMTIHIYDVYQTQPLLVIEPIMKLLKCVLWSVTRPTVFYAATSDGKLLVFDLSENTVSNVATYTLCKDCSVQMLSFNTTEISVLASGSSKGNIDVWSLPSNYVQPKNTDQLFYSNFENDAY